MAGGVVAQLDRPPFTQQPQQVQQPVVPVPPTAATQADAGRTPSINDNVQQMFTRLGVPGAIADASARYGAGDTAGAIGSVLRAAGGAALGTISAPAVPVIRDVQGAGSQLGAVLSGLIGNRVAAVSGAAGSAAASQAPAASPAPTAAQPAGPAPAAPAAAPAVNPLVAALRGMSKQSVDGLLGALAPYSTTAPQRQISDINNANFAIEMHSLDPTSKTFSTDARAALDRLKNAQASLYGNTLQNEALYGARPGLPNP